MSYTLNATQAKWFGFTPKFVWDDFTAQHAVIARELKKATFPLFMEIDENEAAIKKTAEEILRREGIDVATFAERVKRARVANKSKALAMDGPPPYPTRDNMAEDFTALQAKHDALLAEVEQLRAENIRLKQADVPAEIAALRHELTACQSERDYFRGKYHQLAGERGINV